MVLWMNKRALQKRKRYSRIPARISFRTFENPKMVFEGEEKVSEHSGNPLRVSDINKLGNAWKGFLSFGNFSRFPSLILHETLRGFPKRSEAFFYPRKPILGFRNRQMSFRMFGNLFWPVFENTCFFFRVRVVSHIPKFGDASKSPAGDSASLAGDAAFTSGDSSSPLVMRIPRTHIHISRRRRHISRERCGRNSKLLDMWRCW
jgi:hypothetical protein